jgi:hypothetical protein
MDEKTERDYMTKDVLRELRLSKQELEARFGMSIRCAKTASPA